MGSRQRQVFFFFFFLSRCHTKEGWVRPRNLIPEYVRFRDMRRIRQYSAFNVILLHIQRLDISHISALRILVDFSYVILGTI